VPRPFAFATLQSFFFAALVGIARGRDFEIFSHPAGIAC